MANVQRQTKNSAKNYNRQSFNTTPTLNNTKTITPNRQPTNFSPQLAEINEKINRLIESNVSLENNIAALLGKIEVLETNNKLLAEDNITLRADNNALSAKLIATELKLTIIEDDIDSVKQKSLRKTVELLDVPPEAAKDVLGFVEKYTKEIGCDVKDTDLTTFYSRTRKTRNNQTKTKIVLEFRCLKKRRDFYFAGRDHRFQNRKRQDHQQGHSSGAGYRFVKVVDALTYNKKSIFFNIIQQRKERKGVVKNVWISDGEIFIRRFGDSVTAEPVKNQGFVDLLFPVEQDNE
jgi:hypothetical protein